MSYKIIRQTISGQRKQIVSNGILSYNDASERANELDEEMIEKNNVEMCNQANEMHIVEQE